MKARKLVLKATRGGTRVRSGLKAGLIKGNNGSDKTGKKGG